MEQDRQEESTEPQDRPRILSGLATVRRVDPGWWSGYPRASSMDQEGAVGIHAGTRSFAQSKLTIAPIVTNLHPRLRLNLKPNQNYEYTKC